MLNETIRQLTQMNAELCTANSRMHTQVAELQSTNTLLMQQIETLKLQMAELKRTFDKDSNVNVPSKKPYSISKPSPGTERAYLIDWLDSLSKQDLSSICGRIGENVSINFERNKNHTGRGLIECVETQGHVMDLGIYLHSKYPDIYAAYHAYFAKYS